MKKYVLILLVLNSLVLADSSQQLKGLGGLWFWAEPGNSLGSSQTLANTKSAEVAIEFFKTIGLKRLYGEYQDIDFQSLASWNRELGQAGIESQLLLAKSYWIFPRYRHEMFETIQKDFIDFNEFAQKDEEFRAVHLNFEPHALELWKQGDTELRRDLLELMRESLQELKSFFLKQNVEVRLTIDLPVWYDDLNSSIGWRSAADRDQWFSDIDNTVDAITLLSYGRDTSATIINTNWELNKLSSIVSIALDADIGEDKYWHSKQEFLQTFKQLSDYYKGVLSIDIHSYLSFFEY